jgi:hypothetical protein
MKRKEGSPTQSAKIATAAIAALPLLAVAHGDASAQKGQQSDGAAPGSTKKTFVLPHVLEKSGLRATVAGIENGHTIFKSDEDKYFYLDPKTGDQKFVSGHTIKMPNNWRTRGYPIKIKGELSLLGVDGDGNAVMKNSKGEQFYLDPTTGDMISVK